MHLAIDFGTSYTKLGCLQDGRFVNLVGNKAIIPSVATYLPSTGNLYFGNLALRLQEPGALTSRFFKLELKRNPSFHLGPYSLPEIINAYFQFLIKEYCAPLEVLDSITLSVPNYFGLGSRRQLVDAARKATEISNINLVPEPVAALLGHNHCYPDQALEGDILCIDIGGGTTDFSFLSLSGQGRQVMLEAQFQIGNDAFSGSEMDRGVLHNILFPAFVMQTGTPIPDQLIREKNLDTRDRYVFNRLMQQAEAARIQLGQRDSYYCNIPDFYNGQSLNCNLDTELFDTQMQPVFTRLNDYFLTNVRSKAQKLGLLDTGQWQLDYVLLLGGASLTRGVSGLITRLCPGVMVISPPERDSAVVRGLCAWAEEELPGKTTIKSIYPFDFYIEKRTGSGEATSLDKIPFDTGNLELNMDEIYPIFSFPIHSDYNLAARPEDFRCRIYEVTEGEESGEATSEKFLGQEMVLSADNDYVLQEDTAIICLNLKQSRLELAGGAEQKSRSSHLGDWWRGLPDRQLDAAELVKNFPFIDNRLKNDFQQHLQLTDETCAYKSWEDTALYKMLYLIQILGGK